MEPRVRIELTARCLQNSRSTDELPRQIGCRSQDRTDDLLVMSQTRFRCAILQKWSAMLDSNQRYLGPKPSAIAARRMADYAVIY